jgi:hypothetical protein
VGLVVSYFYGPVHVALDFLIRSVVMVGCSYGIAFLAALVINTVRVPWLLDAESGEQINALEKRAQVAETTLSESHDKSQENNRLHSLFGDFLDEGESLADELRRGMQVYGPWLDKRSKWVEKVSQTLTDMKLPTDAAAFRQAGEKDLPIFPPGTVSTPRLYYDHYSSQLTGYRTKLQEIVTRRLP